MSAIAVLKLRMNYFGQECLNVFAYASFGDNPTVADYSALLDLFWDTPAGVTPLAVVDQVQLVVNTSCRIASAEVYSPWNDAILDTRTAPDRLGAVTGEPASPALAYGLRTTRTSRLTRRGMKRFTGVSESFMQAGGVVDPAFVNTNLRLVGEAMARNIDTAAGTTPIEWRPVVLGTPPASLFPGQPRQRYYPSVDQQLANSSLIQAFEPYETVRTQVSRQYDT